jgi:hypothetical protein
VVSRNGIGYPGVRSSLSLGWTMRMLVSFLFLCRHWELDGVGRGCFHCVRFPPFEEGTSPILVFRTDIIWQQSFSIARFGHAGCGIPDWCHSSRFIRCLLGFPQSIRAIHLSLCHPGTEYRRCHAHANLCPEALFGFQAGSTTLPF